MIKILHTADLHLGYRQYGLRQRELDFYDSAANVFDIAIKNDVDAVILAGDIFDAAKPPAEAVFRLHEMISKAKDNGIITLGIDGNHDSTLGRWLSLCGVIHINGCNHTITKGGLNLSVCGIDFTSSKSNFMLSLDIAKKSDADIVVIHQPIAELCNFKGVQLDAHSMLPILDGSSVKYVAMGDIHKANSIELNGITFAYSGSTEANSEDDNITKIVNLIKYDGNITFEPIELKTRGFYIKDITSDDDYKTITEIINNSDNHPVYVLYHTPETKHIVDAIIIELDKLDIMRRIKPRSNSNQVYYDRSKANVDLTTAVSAFFGDDNKKLSIINRMILNPELTREIILGLFK